MASILFQVEDSFKDLWDTWDGERTIFETTVFNILTELPLTPIGLDYVVRTREAGKGLPFANRDVGKALVEVKTAVDGSTTVGGLVRATDLPREQVLGALQIMKKFGWITFQVEIGPKSHLKKKGEPDPENHIKPYGQVVVKFVDFCDGATPLEDVVRKCNVSIAAMKFVATKLVLDGVLEVVA